MHFSLKISNWISNWNKLDSKALAEHFYIGLIVLYFVEIKKSTKGDPFGSQGGRIREEKGEQKEEEIDTLLLIRLISSLDSYLYN